MATLSNFMTVGGVKIPFYRTSISKDTWLSYTGVLDAQDIIYVDPNILGALSVNMPEPALSEARLITANSHYMRDVVFNLHSPDYLVTKDGYNNSILITNNVNYTEFNINAGSTFESINGNIRITIPGSSSSNTLRDFVVSMSPNPISLPNTTSGAIRSPLVLVMDSSNNLFTMQTSTYFNIYGIQGICVAIGSAPNILVAGATADNLYYEDEDGPDEPDPEGDDFMNRFNPRVMTQNVGLYKLTKEDVEDVMDDIWTRDALEFLSELMTGSGAGALQGCYWYYGLNSVISTSSQTNKVTIGKNTIGTTNKKIITKEFVELPMGSVAVSAYYGDARDYATTTYQMYVPFIGLIDLQAIDILGYTIFLEYRINLSDGSAIVQLYRERAGGRYYIYTGDCQFGYSIPLQAEPTKDAISWAMGVVKGNFDNTTGEKYSVGSFAANTNVMSDFTPYLYVTRKDELSDTDFANYKGLPANTTRSMAEFSGYVEVANVLNGGSLPTRRSQEIIDLLKGGVYI